MNKSIRIKTNEEKFFKQLLNVIRSVPPIDKLRPKEVEVLGELLTLNNRYYNVPVKDRNTLIFSTTSREEMRNRLGMSEDSFNNNLSSLRKAGIIGEGNMLHSFFSNIYLEELNKIEFIFKNE